ncbi:MAG: hypothetical protein ACLUFV_02325 [Acutalibacteraceae bacterium]
MTDLPILRQANKLLGLAAGVVLALLRVWLFCAVVRLLLPCADTLGLDFVSASTRRRPSCSNSFTKTISSISSLPEPADAPSGGTRFPRRAAQTLD